MSRRSSNYFNPYASPESPVAEVVDTPPARRLSESTLNFINCVAVIANLGYVAMVAGFYVMLPYYGPSVRRLAIGFYAFTVLAMWVATVLLAFSCRKIWVGVFSVILFLVPIAGTLLFMVTLTSAKERMLENGFTPSILGFTPDAQERELMNSDLTYVPNPLVRHDGTKRPTVYMLAECVFLLAIVGFVVSIFASL